MKNHNKQGFMFQDTKHEYWISSTTKQMIKTPDWQCPHSSFTIKQTNSLQWLSLQFSTSTIGTPFDDLFPQALKMLLFFTWWNPCNKSLGVWEGMRLACLLCCVVMYRPSGGLQSRSVVQLLGQAHGRSVRAYCSSYENVLLFEAAL